MNLQSSQTSLREITFVGLLRSSMTYLPSVLCVISSLKCIHQNFDKMNLWMRISIYYSTYDRFIQRQPCACVRACICKLFL